MSFPYEGHEAEYKNSAKDVAKMLKSKHADNYMVRTRSAPLTETEAPRKFLTVKQFQSVRTQLGEETEKKNPRRFVRCSRLGFSACEPV